MRHPTVDRIAFCPLCGNTIIFRYTNEYQGELPMGGWRLFYEDCIKECNCPLTDEELNDLEYHAKDCEGD